MTRPTIELQELRERIGHRAKSAPTHRFWGMFVHIVKPTTLEAAYLAAKRNSGAAGSDGETFTQIEEAGRAEFLLKLAAERHVLPSTVSTARDSKGRRPSSYDFDPSDPRSCSPRRPSADSRADL